MSNMSAKGKGRDPSPTGSVISAAVAGKADKDKEDKDVHPKVQTPDLFYGDRKKFKAYCTQVRLYWWADKKRTKRTLRHSPRR